MFLFNSMTEPRLRSAIKTDREFLRFKRRASFFELQIAVWGERAQQQTNKEIRLICNGDKSRWFSVHEPAKAYHLHV